MQVGNIAGGGAARVDHHNFHFRPLLFGGGNALVYYRVRPGGVRAGKNQ